MIPPKGLTAAQLAKWYTGAAATKRRQRREAVKDGYCMKCAARPARPGLKTCVECNEAAKAWYYANRNVKKPRVKPRKGS